MVGSSSRLKITLLDGNDFAAEVIGVDRDTDIAIIKIFGSGYTPLETWSTPKVSELVSW